MSLLGQVESVDQALDKVNSLIERGAKDDPEMGAGLASDTLPKVTAAIDKAAVSVTELDAHLRHIGSTYSR